MTVSGGAGPNNTSETAGLYPRRLQRRGSTVAHAARPVDRLGWTPIAACGQVLPGHSTWPVEDGALPLCKRCAKKLDGAS